MFTLRTLSCIMHGQKIFQRLRANGERNHITNKKHKATITLSLTFLSTQCSLLLHNFYKCTVHARYKEAVILYLLTSDIGVRKVQQASKKLILLLIGNVTECNLSSIAIETSRIQNVSAVLCLLDFSTKVCFLFTLTLNL